MVKILFSCIVFFKTGILCVYENKEGDLLIDGILSIFAISKSFIDIG